MANRGTCRGCGSDMRRCECDEHDGLRSALADERASNAALRSRVTRLVGLLREAADPDPEKDNWLMDAIVRALGEFHDGMLPDYLSAPDDDTIATGKAAVEILADGLWSNIVECIDAEIGGGE